MQPSEKYTGVINLLLLNEIIPYVITKEWDLMGSVFQVLVLNRKQFITKLCLKKDRSAPESHRTLYKWRFGVKTHQFEVREIGDNFYHPSLGERLLKGRVKDSELGVYVLNPKDRFYEILYHARFHTLGVTNEEMDLLASLQPQDYKGRFDDREYSSGYLCHKDYFPVKCKDQSVKLELK